MAKEQKGKIEALEVNVVSIEKVKIGLKETLLIFYEDKDKKSHKLSNSMITTEQMFPNANVLFVPFIRR